MMLPPVSQPSGVAILRSCCAHVWECHMCVSVCWREKNQKMSGGSVGKKMYTVGAARGILGQIQKLRYAHCILLTATKVREDSGLDTLERLVGPTIVDIPRRMLVERSFVSDVRVRNVLVPFPHALQGHPKDLVLRTIHPAKLQALCAILHRGIEREHRTLVFCDCLFCLAYIARHLAPALGVPLLGPVTLTTPADARCRLYTEFVERQGATVLLLSRTGDEAIDLPAASQAIIVWNGWASRRQHMQRVGRISRPHGTQQCEFWVLVTDDARERQFVAHRDEYLRMHGFDVTTHECDDLGLHVDEPTPDDLRALCAIVSAERNVAPKKESAPLSIECKARARLRRRLLSK